MKVLVLGASGFLGKWVVKKLRERKSNAIIFEAPRSSDLDLRDFRQTHNLFEEIRPDYVINCASYVGGIQFGYVHPAEIFNNNMRMITNIFEACSHFKVKRLAQPISNCAYPGKEHFFKEDNFWNGPCHESVMVYGVTRRAMTVGAWAYAKQYKLDTVSLVLSNMYGPYDHFGETKSHALSALVKKIVDSKEKGVKEIVVWGTGNPVREWLYVEDGAEALVRALDMDPYLDIINIGTGEGISIRNLAEIIKEVVGWCGNFVFDSLKPDGALHKRVDGSKGEQLLGWKPRTCLKERIEHTVEHYISSVKNTRIDGL